VDLQTTTATRAGGHTVVDYEALIYDGEGVPWVYTVPEPLTFVRAKVTVDRIEGNRVLLSKGLAPGTEVVTVGATEVYGAELEIAGGH
jgi:multidrug efflux pump subunit AcrA (membrane-fusion protein)